MFTRKKSGTKRRLFLGGDKVQYLIYCIYHSKSNNSIENITLPDAYLHSAFIVQNDNLISEVWIADSGASCHMTHKSDMYDVRPPSPGREAITIGDKRCLKVECVGNVDVEFHGCTDMPLTLTDV